MAFILHIFKGEIDVSFQHILRIYLPKNSVLFEIDSSSQTDGILGRLVSSFRLIFHFMFVSYMCFLSDIGSILLHLSPYEYNLNISSSQNFPSFIDQLLSSVICKCQQRSKEEIIVYPRRSYTRSYRLSTLYKNMKPNFLAWKSQGFLQKISVPQRESKLIRF